MEETGQPDVSGNDPQSPKDSFKDQSATSTKEDGKGKKGNSMWSNFKWGWISIGTAASMGVNGVSMALGLANKSIANLQPSSSGTAGKAFTATSGGITAGIAGPMVLYSEYRLKSGETLRDNINAIRHEANRLAEENTKLSSYIDQLEDDVGRLKDIESALRDLAETQGESLEQLMLLVKENKRINRKMKKILAGMQMQQVLDIVMECDQNGDFTFDEDELEILILKLKNLESVQEKFDEKKFRQSFHGREKSVGAFISLARDLLPVEEFEEETDDESEFESDSGGPIGAD